VESERQLALSGVFYCWRFLLGVTVMAQTYSFAVLGYSSDLLHIGIPCLTGAHLFIDGFQHRFYSSLDFIAALWDIGEEG